MPWDYPTLLIMLGEETLPALVRSRYYFTELCSGSEAGSYLRLIDFVYHSTLGWRVIQKNKMRYSFRAKLGLPHAPHHARRRDTTGARPFEVLPYEP